MIDLSKYGGKKIKITFEDGAIIEAVAEDYMNGDDYDEEFNSLALQVTKVIKESKKYPFSPFINSNALTAIYENENVKIEEI